MRVVTREAVGVTHVEARVRLVDAGIAQRVARAAKLRDRLLQQRGLRRGVTGMAVEALSARDGRVHDRASLPQTRLQFRMAGEAELSRSAPEQGWVSGPVRIVAALARPSANRLVDRARRAGGLGDVRMTLGTE